MIEQKTQIDVTGICSVYDVTDGSNTHIFTKKNAIHLGNMARVFARALAGESNCGIESVALGNGGTYINASLATVYRTPNSGVSPDASGWRSRLYNETYRENINDNGTKISTGTGSVPSSDPTSVVNDVVGPGVVSIDNGTYSIARVSCVLNADEPTGQYPTAVSVSGDYAFTFDEIGLYTSGAPLNAISGMHDVNVSTRNSTDDTGLQTSYNYTFDIVVDGTTQTISFTTPPVGSGVGGTIIYSDLVSLINSNMVGATASIDDSTHMTYGYLRFTSASAGATSSVNVVSPLVIPTNWLFDGINSFVGFMASIPGKAAGAANSPNAPHTEAERLLAHLIFDPVTKAADRSYRIEYDIVVQLTASA